MTCKTSNEFGLVGENGQFVAIARNFDVKVSSVLSKMNRFLYVLIFLVSLDCFTSEGSKLKDLVTIKGVRENPVIGYGLVIGLNGTGDGGGEITNTSLKRMFQKLGLNPQQEIASKNVCH